MKKEKRKFVGVGQIQGTDIMFTIYSWAYSEAQFRLLAFLRLKKKYPQVNFTSGSLVCAGCPKKYHFPYEVWDITGLDDKKIREIVIYMKKPVH
ncbi:MAG: hypothetical protein QMD65_02665 [Patescibacteria group bacterium]|nr:hypothetical protein [Patescibacteria group bacterium]